jgi:hypothetical protein
MIDRSYAIKKQAEVSIKIHEITLALLLNDEFDRQKIGLYG